MNIGTLGQVNIVTALIACIFLIPVLFGVIRPLTGDRMQRSVFSLGSNLIFLASLVLSVYLTRILLSDSENVILVNLYKVLPQLHTAVLHKDIWVSALFMLILLLSIDGVLDLLALPIYKYVVTPVLNRLASRVNKMRSIDRRTLGGLWQLPKSVWLVLIFALLLNFYTQYNSASAISESASDSAPYQFIEGNVIQPLLNSSAVKNIQVLLNDSFGKAKNDLSDAAKGHLTRYFNGVTLEEAIKSNPEIDAAAKKIVGSEKDDRRKALLIYRWVSKNIGYDNGKAATIAADPSRVSSGAVVAYQTRTGVCFDYSCLYVAMCRAVGLNVRFVTGLGYTGVAWGDHAWNQVYYPKESRWINVDTTFGSSGVDYFDRPNFDLDHKDAVIQGEW